MNTTSRPRVPARRIRAQAVAITASLALVAVPLTGATASSPGDRGAKESLTGESAPVSLAAQPTVVGGLIVTYEPGKANVALSAAASASRTAGIATARNTVAISDTASSVRFDELVDLATAEALASQVATLPGVVAVQPDALRQAAVAPPVTPNDTHFGYQHSVWDSRNAADLPAEVVPKWTAGGFSVRAPSLWQATQGSSKVVVAILDTGRTAHPDLDANTVPGYDMIVDTFVSNDGNGRDADPSDPGDWTLDDECVAGWAGADSSWHGTHVAGTVAARANDAYGVAGIAPGSRVQHVRVLGKCGGYDSDIAAGITWASGGAVAGLPANATPAKVLNLSLGGPGACHPVVQDAINGARSRGSVVVVAAGNSGMDAANFSPANCANVITVAATDFYGQWTSYTNYGNTVEVSAPGGDYFYGEQAAILSTLNSGTAAPSTPGWAFYQGTSMAAPAVSGVAALIASLGSFTAPQIETALQSAVSPFPQYGIPGDCDRTCGLGIIDASKVPAALGVSKISGSRKLGGKLTGTPVASWHGAPAVSYQWLRNGAVISGATKTTYKVTKADIGKKLQFRTVGTKAGFPAIYSTSAATAVVPKVSTKVTVKLKSKKIKRTAKAKLTVTVKTSGISKPTGKIKVYFGKKSKTYTLKASKKGKLTVTLPKLKKGTYKIKAKYTPTGKFKTYTKAKNSSQIKLKVK